MAARAATRIGSSLFASMLACGAVAQQIELAPSDALRCLSPEPPERYDVEYPFASWKNGEKGRVKVELTFGAADRRPAVRVLESEGTSEFVDAVKERVRQWRVPCLPSGQQATLVQEFIFRPDDRKVFWEQTADAGDAQRKQASACLSHVSGEGLPAYPRAARRDWIQGRIYTELSFRAAAEPPVATIHARDNARALKNVIEEWVKGYRLACLPDGATVNLSLIFVYRLEGEAFGFKPLTLRQLLPSVKGIEKQTLVLDTAQMACPFDVRFTYLQPVKRNRVGTVGGADATRRPLLEWLAGIELKLPESMIDAVFADSTTISVPCIKINLNPKEPT